MWNSLYDSMLRPDLLEGAAVWALRTTGTTAVVYAFVIVAFRLVGKRLLAQLNPFDLVVLLLLSNTLQDAMVAGDRVTLARGLVSALTLLFVNERLVRFLVRHESVERAVEGGPDHLIAQGRIDPKSLVREHITEAELRAAAHRQGFESFAEIDSAELDPGGILSFHRKHETDDRTQHLAVMERLDRIERLLGDRRTSA